MPRFFTPQRLVPGCTIELEPSAARHVQVLRLQPGDAITLFNGLENDVGVDGEYAAHVKAMGRTTVSVVVSSFARTRTGPARVVHLAVGMPANDRMDWLIEKATELGVTSISPVMTERSVLRLEGERLAKKLAHWRAVAIAASEQCGRSCVPLIGMPTYLATYLKTCVDTPPEESRRVSGSAAGGGAGQLRLVLSLQAGAVPLSALAAGHGAFTLLSGPEGGLSPAEEVAARAAGFAALSLGPRTLRSETAPLAALSYLQLM